MHAFNLRTWERDRWISFKFEASLVYTVLGQLDIVRPCLRKQKPTRLIYFARMTGFHGFYDVLECVYHIFFSHSSFGGKLDQFNIFTSKLLYVWINGF